MSLILVTGGTGFLGRTLVGRLVAAGHRVRILSRTASHSDDASISVLRGDITSLSDLKQSIHGCSEIFHCAAEKIDQRCMLRVNVVATEVLFNLAVDSDVKFFCQLSSVGAIGRSDKQVVDESTTCNPTNPYEHTKLQAEEIVSKGLSSGTVVILRPTNIFGAETISSWMDNTMVGKARRFLKGNEGAHLVYVKDVAAAAVYLYGRSADASVDTYIVSSDEQTGNTNREVQTWLSRRVAGIPNSSPVSPPIIIPYLMRRITGRAANRGDMVYSSRKLRNAGFRFSFGLEGGLIDAIGSLPTLPGDRSRESDSFSFPQA